MSTSANLKSAQRTTPSILCALILATAVATVKPAIADEGGVSFWVPGFVGSLAATPQVPGFSFAASDPKRTLLVAVTRVLGLGV